MKVHFKLLFIGLALWSCSKEEKKPEKVLSIDERIELEQERLINWYTLLYDFDYKQDSSKAVKKAHNEMLELLNKKHKQITGTESPTYLTHKNFDETISTKFKPSNDNQENERNIFEKH